MIYGPVTITSDEIQHSAMKTRLILRWSRHAANAVAFYNMPGVCDQRIKETKGAIKWTRLSCRSFSANVVQLKLENPHILRMQWPRRKTYQRESGEPLKKIHQQNQLQVQITNMKLIYPFRSPTRNSTEVLTSCFPARRRTGKNGRHALVGMFRQLLFGRLAGYVDITDAGSNIRRY